MNDLNKISGVAMEQGSLSECFRHQGNSIGQVYCMVKSCVGVALRTRAAPTNYLLYSRTLDITAEEI